MTQSVSMSFPAFERRLNPSSAAPIAVAFSGGGDSLTALIATLAWARERGRPVLALCVDHGLQQDSAAWADWARRTATRLGADARVLVWEGDKPSRGRSAAARLARHRLIADAAREAGARVVVLGHTADDRLEAALMRAWGSSLGSPREWAPSPVWPHGRSVFLLRPLLDQRRAILRDQLWALGETWIDDPANVDQRSLRARARQMIAEHDLQPDPLEPGAAPAAPLARAARVDDSGALWIARAVLAAADPAGLTAFVGAAALSVGGGERPPRRDRVEALAARLRAAGAFTATLAGAKIIADDQVLIVRDAGEAARGGLAPVALAAGRAAVWDGRFLLSSDIDAVAHPLAGQFGTLDPAARGALRTIVGPARAGSPFLIGEDGRRTCPILAGAILAGNGWGRSKSLVAERLMAACAAISREPGG